MGMTGGHYLFLGVLPEEVGEAAGINDLYAARFGAPPAGKRVFIRTVQQINGWQDRPQTFSARVPPSVALRHVQPATLCYSPSGGSGGLLFRDFVLPSAR
jgi:hypothetical protein